MTFSFHFSLPQFVSWPSYFHWRYRLIPSSGQEQDGLDQSNYIVGTWSRHMRKKLIDKRQPKDKRKLNVVLLWRYGQQISSSIKLSLLVSSSSQTTHNFSITKHALPFPLASKQNRVMLIKANRYVTSWETCSIQSSQASVCTCPHNNYRSTVKNITGCLRTPHDMRRIALITDAFALHKSYDFRTRYDINYHSSSRLRFLYN
jgi:hypothetical protein